MGTKQIQLTGGAPATAGNQNWTPPAGAPPNAAPFGLITALPPAPDAWNLEARLMTSPDLAANGWTVQRQDAPYTAYTRAGDIDWTLVPSSNTYRSSLVNGVLVLQLPNATGTQISKALPAPFASQSIESHIWATLDTDNSYSFLGETQNYLAAGKYSYYCGVEASKFVEVLATGPSTFNTIRQPALGGGFAQLDLVRWMHFDLNLIAGKTEALIPSGRRTSATVLSTAWATLASPPTHAGIWMSGSTGSFMFVDYIRRQPLRQFP